MDYLSTRGQAPFLTFADALLAGLAEDGGLYVPQAFPHLTFSDMTDLAGLSYETAAERLITPFVGDAFPPLCLSQMLTKAMGTFRHSACTPLVQLLPHLFVLELFHGPTLAFKDVAMQLLGHMLDYVLTKRSRRATIIGATSGDTGAAALEAFRGLTQVDVFILYPKGRVSDVQRRQMTSVTGENTYAIAVEGTFDDCQALVKALFRNTYFREEMQLSGVNSINWARILAQIVYYFVAGLALGAPHRPISFTVPTGNFGNILAGYVAKRMGLPIERLVIASNQNDILTRLYETGIYSVQGVHSTQSPSMDIQISSNFERLLFEILHRSAQDVCRFMVQLQEQGSFTLPQDAWARIRTEFDAFRTFEDQTQAEMARTYRETGYILDPHTAVGMHAARRALAQRPEVPMIVLSTAHPAKFPDSVQRATGVHPQLPPHLADLRDRKERLYTLPKDQSQLEAFIRAHRGQG